MAWPLLYGVATMTTLRYSRFAVAATLAAPLVFAAPRALADEPSNDPNNAILKSVTIDSTRPGTLIERLSSVQDQRSFDIPILSYEQPTWSPFCVTPCRAKVDLNGVYRVGPQNGVTTSQSFTLSPDVLALHVNAGLEHGPPVGEAASSSPVPSPWSRVRRPCSRRTT